MIKEGGGQSVEPHVKEPKGSRPDAFIDLYRCFEMFGKYKNEARKGPGHSLDKSC